MSSPVGSWVDVPCKNREAAPSSRYLSACAVYKDCLYVFGGRRKNGLAQFGDFHEFSFARKLWRVVPATGDVPRARYGHTCVVYKEALYVFGGCDGSSALNDLMKYDFLTQQWSAVVVANGSAPSARYYHSAVVYDKSMYVFGGSSAMRDLHEFNFETRTWARVDVSGRAPQPRNSASLVVFKNTAILFGGYNGSGSLNELHMFDFGKWSAVGVGGLPPHPRRGHVAVVCANSMYVFGGEAFTAVSDLFELTLDESKERQWKPMSSNGTLPRACSYHTAAVYDSSLIVFGGQGNENNLTQCRLKETKYTDSVAIPDSSFLSCLRSLVNNELTSDVKFIVEGAPIYAHRNLCMRCNYFKAMLTSEMLESRTREVLVTDVSRSTFLVFLEYLYTDEVDQAVEDAMELLVVADRYGVDRLKSICENRILVSLCVDNAAALLYAADVHSVAGLRGHCVSFIVNNFDEVSKTQSFDDMSRKNVELVLELLKLR